MVIFRASVATGRRALLSNSFHPLRDAFDWNI
jgi:hypothetical protein